MKRLLIDVSTWFLYSMGCAFLALSIFAATSQIARADYETVTKVCQTTSVSCENVDCPKPDKGCGTDPSDCRCVAGRSN
jgi:hypothetical protein